MQSPEESLVDLSGSRDDGRLWQSKGWISFDVDAEKELEDPLLWEIEFIRNLARSGLSDAQINQLLRNVPKPYRFDPSRAAFHFVYGWVVPREDDPFDVIDKNLDDWLTNLADEGDQNRLSQIAERITELMEDDSEEEIDP